MLSPEGCRTNWRADQRYRLNDARLARMSFDGAVAVGDVNVVYQYGLTEQAGCLAHQIEDLVAHVEDATGVDIRLGTKVYLLRVDEVPTGYDMSLGVEPDSFAMPLFVRAGNESCEAIVGANRAYPVLFMHEMTEMSLVFHEAPGVVMPDAAGQVLFFRPKLLNYTRWFREGMANYAAYRSYLKLRSETKGNGRRMRWSIHSRPFSSLGRVGNKLFRWHQYSRNRLDGDYYNAAFGLFLLMDKVYGPETVPRIMKQVYRRDYLNGEDLVGIVNDVLGADVRELAERFSFPAAGLRTREMTKALALNERIDVEEGLFVVGVQEGTMAEQAGIKERDTILGVNGTQVTNILDLELALFDARDADEINVRLWRRGRGEMALRLPLAQ